jgi:hypothetical protein
VFAKQVIVPWVFQSSMLGFNPFKDVYLLQPFLKGIGAMWSWPTSVIPVSAAPRIHLCPTPDKETVQVGTPGTVVGWENVHLYKSQCPRVLSASV